MEIILKFYRPEEKMPERFENSDTSHDCLAKTKDSKYYDFAYYDFKEQKWEDATSWNDCHGYKELENVEMWAQIPCVGKNFKNCRKHKPRLNKQIYQFKFKIMFGIKLKKQTEKEELSLIIERLKILRNNHTEGDYQYSNYDNAVFHLLDNKELIDFNGNSNSIRGL